MRRVKRSYSQVSTPTPKQNRQRRPRVMKKINRDFHFTRDKYRFAPAILTYRHP